MKRVSIKSGFLTMVDSAYIREFCLAENELTDIPLDKVHSEATSGGHTAITVRNEYGKREYPVFVQLDNDNHVLSVRISFIE